MDFQQKERAENLRAAINDAYRELIATAKEEREEGYIVIDNQDAVHQWVNSFPSRLTEEQRGKFSTEEYRSNFRPDGDGAFYGTYFKEVYFKCPVHIKNREIPSLFVFDNCKFDCLYIERCNFNQTIKFETVNIFGGFFLDDCFFNEYVFIKGSSFSEILKGKHRGHVGSSAQTSLRGLTIRDGWPCIIENCRFYNGAKFNESTFGGMMKLKSVEVWAASDFEKLNFEKCTFKKDVHITGLKTCHSEPPSNDINISFRKAGFNDVLNLSVREISSLDMSQCTFYGRVRASGITHGYVRFNNAVFEDGARLLFQYDKAPYFHGAQLHSDSFFPPIETFKDRGLNTQETGKGIEDLNHDASHNYRELRQLAQKNLSDDEVQKFRAMELESRLNTQTAKDETFFSRCYKQINNYGLSLWKPLSWLGGIVVISFLSYWLIWEMFFTTIQQTEVLGKNSYIFYPAFLPNGLQYSISSALKSTLGVFIIALESPQHPWPANILHALFVIISSVLWFFFIFGIRRRFKI